MWIDSKKENFFFFCIGIAALLTYSYVIATEAIDMPKWDDFPDILQFMDRWLQAHSLSEKVQVFFYHTNEHILLVNHLLILGQYYLLGQLDFAGLIYLGNLFYAGSALVLWLHFRTSEHSARAFALLMLCAVAFYPYDSTLWAMTALSNQAVIFFAFLAIYFASQPAFPSVKVMGCGALAIFSQSNGLLVLPVIALLVYRQHRHHLLSWLLFSAAVIAAYAAAFNPASLQAGATPWPELTLKNYLLTPLIFFATFGGIPFNAVSTFSVIAAIATGLLVFSLALRSAWKNELATFPAFVLLFLLLSLASIGFYRGLVGGPEVAFTSRYKMYAMDFLVLGVLLSPALLAWQQRSALCRYSVLLLALLFFVASFALNLPHYRLINGHLRESLQYWAEDGDLRRSKGFFVKDADSYLFAALHNGSWSPVRLLEPDRIIDSLQQIPHCPVPQDKWPVDSPRQPRLQHINRNAPMMRLEGPSATYYLCSDGLSYRFVLASDDKGSYYLPATDVAPGQYQLLIEEAGKVLEAGTGLLRKAHTR